MTQQLRTVELDFDAIKTNLKAFLKSKPEFTDYDFEGSGLSVIMDLLAYNTHYAAMLANLQTAEMFLDTATKLSTVALHAKRLGYLPKSKRAATAIVDLEIFPGINTPATLTIGRNASFTSATNGLSFDFVTTSAKTVARDSNGRYVFRNLEIKEGAFTTFRYVFDKNNKQPFVIPSQDVDIETLNVRVQVSATNTNSATWIKSQSIADIKSDSKVFYVKMNRSGFFEVEFGDGVISEALQDGNIVTLEYLECSGKTANGLKYFSFTDTVEGFNSNALTVVSPSFGGADMETLDSIKKRALAASTTQNRAVTSSDYGAMIWDIYPYEDISVWGGEDNNPPEYGKAFVCIKPGNGIEFLSQAAKDAISNELKKRKSIVTGTVKFVDPDYTDLIVNCSYWYSDKETVLAESSISTLVKAKIEEYAANNIGKFSSKFSASKLSEAINSVGSYIVSNITTISLCKKIPFLPLNQIKTTYKLGNAVKQSNNMEQHVSSDWFLIQGNNNRLYIDDNNGILRAYYLDGDVRKTAIENFGTINYSTGAVTIEKAAIVSSKDGQNVSLYFTPVKPDVVSYQSSILRLDTEKMIIDGIVEPVNKNEMVG